MHVFSPSRLATATVAVLGTLVAGSAWAAPTLPTVDSVGTPQYTTVGGVVPDTSARTIPHFDFTETDPTNGATYALTMVGAGPDADTTTSIPTEIIPLRVIFDSAGGYPLDGTDRVDATIASPIFSDFQYDDAMAGGDVGQYGDVFMRAQFNTFDSAYHVKLGAPEVLPTVTIEVPITKGYAGQTSHGAVFGLVDYDWFSAQLQNVMSQLQIDPRTLPMFLTNNVMLYISSTANCCVIGYHGASKVTGYGYGSTATQGHANINTFLYSAYTTPGTFGTSGIQDIHALGHEVAEWLDDPFIDNVVQPWLTPTAPQYGCTSFLEVGDPVVGIWFGLEGNPDPNKYAQGMWHPEDEVFWPWFLRQNPSSAFNGNYTFMGPYNPFPGFQVPATGCN